MGFFWLMVSFAAMSGHWRLTFLFEGADVVLADYRDYH
jgi:plasmid maintenance system killer protein